MKEKLFEHIGSNEFRIAEMIAAEENDPKPYQGGKYFCLFDATPLQPVKIDDWAEKYKCPKCRHQLLINKDGGWSYQII
jgi:hypothetical protein